MNFTNALERCHVLLSLINNNVHTPNVIGGACQELEGPRITKFEVTLFLLVGTCWLKPPPKSETLVPYMTNVEFNIET